MPAPIGPDTHELVGAAIEEHLRPASEAVGAAGQERSEATARRARAVTLRLTGLTYQQIAEQVGYSDAAACRATVLRSLDRYEATQVAELRQVENARLDRAQAAIWPKVIGGDIKAVDTWLRLSARRARMNGLDAPQQISVTPTTQAGLQDALADLRMLVLGEVLDVHDDNPDEV